MKQATFAEVMAARDAKTRALQDANSMTIPEAEHQHERLRVYPAPYTRELTIDTGFNSITISEEYCVALKLALEQLFPWETVSDVAKAHAQREAR